MRKLLPLFLVLITVNSFAQAPAGYYSTATGLSSVPLKAALHNVIKNHTSISYAQIWTAYQSTDAKPDGKVWDIYSDIPNGTPPYEFTFGTNQCGNYTVESDCYNREHSWPKSYFNSVTPMYTDLFHIYPTDGYVNNKRDNYPYGLVDTTGTFWQSENGSRLGPNRFPGYTGVVFEPIDAYKGDLARTYFYMATRYYTEDAGWQNWAMSNGANLTPWAVAMLLEWSHTDTVSLKEMNRNNAIYAIQHNRNPFIDHPEYIDCIWSATGCDIPLPLAVNGTPEIESIKVFPNPATEKILINDNNIANKAIEIDIINPQGRIIYHRNRTINAGIFEIPVSQYPRGLYWIKVSTESGINVSKIVLQ
jgi:endonuclease I